MSISSDDSTSESENEVNKKQGISNEIHKSKKPSENLYSGNKCIDQSPKHRNYRSDKECKRRQAGRHERHDHRHSERHDHGHSERHDHRHSERHDHRHSERHDHRHSERHDHSFRESRKRSRSQERQRYGKWIEDSYEIKDTQSDLKQRLARSEAYSDNRGKYNSSKYITKHSKREIFDKYKNALLNYSENFNNKNGKFCRIETNNKERKSNRQFERYQTSKRYNNKRKYFHDTEAEINGRENFYKSNPLNERSCEYVDLDKPRKEDEFAVDISKSSDAEKVNLKEAEEAEPLTKKIKVGNINTKTGSAYIPSAKLKLMQENIKDKNSEEYQRIAWEALKRSIVRMTNKINSSNLNYIVHELFKENIIRGRGILARAIMQAQAASACFTQVYAALVAVINSKFPEIGELILNRLITQYKRAFRRNDKITCMSSGRFLAHLLNQEVIHEVLILEMLIHLLENPTEDSVEIAIALLKVCGKILTLLATKAMKAVTQRVLGILNGGSVNKRVCQMIEAFLLLQRSYSEDYEIIPKELDLIEAEDKYTHLINLNDAVDSQDILNVFKFDPKYSENEETYKSIVKDILGDSDGEDDKSETESNTEGEEEEEGGKGEKYQQIMDMTENSIVNLRRQIYLTMHSSLTFEECAHKMLQLKLKYGQHLEMCYMIVDCCTQQRTYQKFYGLLAQRFCQLKKKYVGLFSKIFRELYETVHRLETNKLRNVAMFFAHLLYTDAISWRLLSIIKLNEKDTTSSSRIFIKVLFQQLSECMNLSQLNERVKDVTLQRAFAGLFPRSHPHDTRFAINFFTSIGLGSLTDDLREHLNMQKNSIRQAISQDQDTSSTCSSSS